MPEPVLVCAAVAQTALSRVTHVQGGKTTSSALIGGPQGAPTEMELELQLSAVSLQPTAFSLQPTAVSLQPTAVSCNRQRVGGTAPEMGREDPKEKKGGGGVSALRGRPAHG